MRLLAALALASLGWAGDVPAPQIKAAASRAIARLQASQKDWYSETSCDSCHHQFLPAMAFRDARQHGIAVDEKIAREDAAQAYAHLADLDRAIENAHTVDPGIGNSYVLLGADAAGVRPSLVTAVYARYLAQRQEPDGHWITFDERPPVDFSLFTATALAARTIEIYSHPSLKADTQRRREKAREWLAAHTPRDTEDRTFQLLGLLWTGADSAARTGPARALAKLQRPDGGWAQLDSRASDAYATSEALVALHDAGAMAVTDPVWQRGVEFLLRTQVRDGTWHVRTRLNPPAPLSPDYFESGYPYGHDQYLSAIAASWAVMALARALPQARTSSLPPVREAEPSKIPAWAETILFGGEDEVKRSLDAGLDPNAATAEGTSALMMAAPDAAKLKLLLDRGAKVNARTQDGYSALLMAALYRDSAPAVRLLLDRGAEIRSQTPVLYRGYPLALAAIAGSAESVNLLRDAGDLLDQDYIYAGLQPGSPLILITTMGEADVARTLLDRGAQPDHTDPDGLTALAWAVLSNKIEIATLLIAHGADVNHVDMHGMTPLLYAASIDFGDSEMIQVLLKSGARRDARTKEGLTALELARKYDYARLIRSLQ